ncbi:MAG: cation transporter [Spirochaetia bacterium]|nr:cation transporter [Spirochaetia bacterium]
MKSTVLIVFIIAIVMNATANILIKASTFKKNEGFLEYLPEYIREVFNPIFISGVISFGLALIAYRFVLANGMKLSVAYPIMTTSGFAIVILASRVFFKETLHPVQWGGIALLALGLWLVASKVTA